MQHVPENTFVVSVVMRKGEQVMQTLPVNVPKHVATGNYERLSDRALKDTIVDLASELERRQTGAALLERVDRLLADSTGTYRPDPITRPASQPYDDGWGSIYASTHRADNGCMPPRGTRRQLAGWGR